MKKYIVRVTFGDRYGTLTKDVEVEANDQETAEKLAKDSVHIPGDEICYVDSVSECSEKEEKINYDYDDDDWER